VISPFSEPSIHKTCRCTEKPHLILRIQVLWRGTAILWNTGNYSHSDTASHHRRTVSSQTQPWDSQI
jgi:hypothetical protein